MNTKATVTTSPDWSSILRLEDAILRVSGLTDLLVSRYASTVDDEEASPHQSSVLAGIMSLEASAFSELHESFEDVTAYARHLKTRSRRR